MSLYGIHIQSLHVEQHVVGLFQHSLEDGQPLCSNSTVDHSVVAAESDAHHIGHGEPWGGGREGGEGEEMQRSVEEGRVDEHGGEVK